jgi:L-asparaginase II
MEPFARLVELTRGPLVESIHFGALAVVDAAGALVASVGDPELVANMRSAAKPFQFLPCVEDGGADRFGLSERELALACSSHSATPEHVSVLKGMQAKIGVGEENLSCGAHYPVDEVTARAMRERGEKPTSNHHNCSGKHTGMLANARLHGFEIEDYLNPAHPLQQLILKTFAEMVSLPVDQVVVGIDGCSAPTFAAPLRNAAHAFALLADPSTLTPGRAVALRRICAAMIANPDMVAGPARWDTTVMQAAGGKVVSKSGAEGFQAMGVLPGVLGPGSPALGIALKIVDGDVGGRAAGTAAMAVLAQLGVLDEQAQSALAQFDRRLLRNWRGIEVGEVRAAFQLQRISA